MRTGNIKELLKQAIDIQPSIIIKKIKDWKAIDSTSIHLEGFYINLNETERNGYFSPPYAELRVKLHSMIPHSEEPFFLDGIFVAMHPDDRNRPDIYQFERISSAIDFIRTTQTRFTTVAERAEMRDQNLIKDAYSNLQRLKTFHSGQKDLVHEAK